MKIAVYAISLNEAKHVKRWAEATKGADLRIVADTGSTDDTVKLLKKYGVEVHNISVKPFRFDDARNSALALVPNDVDVCVSLDLDEIPDPDFFDKIRESWKPDTDRAWVGWETKNIWMNNNRVHARHGYRWIAPCHEVTVKYPPVAKENDIIVDSVVRHRPDDSKSRGQYLHLLQMGCAENPYDIRLRTYLIREYYFNKQWDNVVYESERLFATPGVDRGWNSELAATCRGAGDSLVQLGRRDEALQWLLKGTELTEELEAWYPLAFYYYENKEWQKCFDALNKDFTKGTHYLVDESLYDWRRYDLLAIASWNLGKKGSAKKWARLAMEANPTDKRLVDNYQFMLKGQ